MRTYLHFKNGVYLRIKTYSNIFSLIGVFVFVSELT